MSRLVKRHPSATGKLERGREPPPLFGDLTRELDAFGLQLCDRRGDVVAHQVKLMVSTLVARMGGEFRGRKGEDEPTPAGVDRVESERVAEERTSTFGVVCEDDRVYAGDHRRPSLWVGGHSRKGGHAAWPCFFERSPSHGHEIRLGGTSIVFGMPGPSPAFAAKRVAARRRDAPQLSSTRSTSRLAR